MRDFGFFIRKIKVRSGANMRRNNTFSNFFIKNTIHIWLAFFATPFLVENRIPKRIKYDFVAIFFHFSKNMRMRANNERRAVIHEKMREILLIFSRIKLVFTPPVKHKNFLIAKGFFHIKNVIFRIVKRIYPPSFMSFFIKIFSPVVCVGAETEFAIIFCDFKKFFAFSNRKSRMKNFRFIKRFDGRSKAFKIRIKNMIIRKRNNSIFLFGKPFYDFNIFRI